MATRTAVYAIASNEVLAISRERQIVRKVDLGEGNLALPGVQGASVITVTQQPPAGAEYVTVFLGTAPNTGVAAVAAPIVSVSGTGPYVVGLGTALISDTLAGALVRYMLDFVTTQPPKPFTTIDTTHFAVAIDPAIPDGPFVREPLPDGVFGPERVLGWAKHYIPGTNTIRNSTQAEIDAYPATETDIKNTQDQVRAQEMIDVDPLWRKVFKGLVDGIVQEDERIRTQWEDFKAGVAAANNLADIKAAVAALPALAPRTKPQVIAFLRSLVSKDD